jgi:ADP-L-glycero-D-manno-heptose 6-epimerase
VVHLGANSDTTASDGDEVLRSNFKLSLMLLDWCTQARTPFIYASSAATYGDGSAGFDDDGSPAALKRLAPLNLYGWSKHLFDQVVAERAARSAPLPPQWAGLKFFNVFGPNEYHKGAMQSVVAKMFPDAAAGRRVALFKSHREGIADGEQKRDFIYVDDAVAVMQWLLATPRVSGIFNVGTGEPRSFRDLVTALFNAIGRTPDITYVDMPEAFCDRYQYFTRAEMDRLRRAGFNAGFTPLEAAVKDYATRFLAQPDRYR